MTDFQIPEEMLNELETEESKPVDEQGEQDESQEETEETPKYSSDELLAIFDEILFKGEYRETIPVAKKLNIVLRSRSTGETAFISRHLDSLDYKLLATMEDERVLVTLAHSLVEFRGKDLTKMEPLPKRYEFINTLPSAILGILINKLQEFDEKVFLATEEASKNF